MIRKAADMVKELRQKMRGGTGEVKIRHIYKQDELKGKARLVAEITLNPGCSIGYHEHRQEEEIYYILSGTGVVEEADGCKDVGPGDAILTGGGAGHALANAGQVPLVFIALILLYV